MKKIAIIVTMLLTISTFAQVNPSQPTQNSENAAHKRNNQAVFLFSFKENECKKIPLTEKSSFADFGAKRPFRTFNVAVKRKVFLF